MGRHHAGHAGGDGGAKGGQLHSLEPLAAVGQQGQLEMGIAGRVAMAGEVLGAAQHPLRLGAAHEGGRQGSGGGGGLTPGPHVDHRVGGVVIHIAHRAQHPVEAEGPGLAAAAAPVALRQLLGRGRIIPVKAAEGQGRHQPAGTLEPLAHPLLHIGAEQEIAGRPRLELAGAQPQFGRAAPEQDHSPHPRAQQALQGAVIEFPAGVAALAVGQVTAAAHHQQAGHQAGQVAGLIRLACLVSADPLPDFVPADLLPDFGGAGLLPDFVHAVIPVGTMQAQ